VFVFLLDHARSLLKKDAEILWEADVLRPKSG
jgi:hypothetical protein